MKQALLKQVVLIFLGQKLSSWSIQQQQLRYDLGGKEERANNRNVCACIFFPNINSYILVSHAISDVHDKWHVYFLKGFRVFSGRIFKEVIINSTAVSSKLLVHVCQLGPHFVLVQKGFKSIESFTRKSTESLCPNECSLDRKMGAVGVILVSSPVTSDRINLAKSIHVIAPYTSYLWILNSFKIHTHTYIDVCTSKWNGDWL